jgi:orotidine-5'-phosphate decarboxylase
MGSDSVKPFLEYKNKWAIILALTSNEGAKDFQMNHVKNNSSVEKQLFEEVLSVSQNWGTKENMMFVIGATQAEMFDAVRKIIPDHFLLVPGVGAQGGDLKEVSKHGLNKECGLLINSSRNIIYASKEDNFAEHANAEAKKIQTEMDQLLNDLM